MCLGIPMQIRSLRDQWAECEANGIRRNVNLMLMAGQALQTGDFVMVHVGYAIQKVEPQQARSAWELFDAMHEGGRDA